MSDLPLRMTAIEVCQLGRFSLATLTRYLPRDSVLALQAQRRRGLVGKAR